MPVDTHLRDVKNESRRLTMTKRNTGLISSFDNVEAEEPDERCYLGGAAMVTEQR